MTLTAIVLTRNSQATLDTCLSSLRFADQILVIDDNSTDKTHTIAKRHHAKIIPHSLVNFAAQRNFALKQATSDWILFVDSDESVPPALAKQITKAIKSSTVNGYYLKRQDIFLNKTLHHGETSQVRLLRLAKKSAGIWQRPVHEFWQIKGKVFTLTHPLLHQRHLSFSQFIDKLNHYTDLDVKALLAENKPFSYLDLLLKPLGKFVYNYLFLLGFLDGFPGFVMAFSMSLHSLIVRIKLYEHATT